MFGIGASEAVVAVLVLFLLWALLRLAVRVELRRAEKRRERARPADDTGLAEKEPPDGRAG